MALNPGKKMNIPEDLATSRESTAVRALVVDDDPLTLKLVSHMLTVIGFRVDTAEGGLSAKCRLSQSRYALVVTDLQMPDMDGYALASWLKHKFRDTKVLVMTGCCQAEVVHCINSGIVDGWVFKPFSLRDLAGIVSKFALMDHNEALCRSGNRHRAN